MSENRGALEAELLAARDAASRALERKLESQIPLAALEDRAKRARARRKAAEESRQITERAAIRAGLASSRVTIGSLGRLQSVIDAARDEVRAMIASSKEVCEHYDRCCDALHSAREKEADVLRALLAVPAATPSAASKPSRRTVIERELIDLQLLQEREESERRAQMLWMRDEAFDPHYDAWEIAVRRSRPWV